MDTNNKVFFAKDSKGKEKEYEVIYTFSSEQTKKDYIIYTDGKKEDGLLKVYANTFDSVGKSKELKPIETEEEWNTIEVLLAKMEDLIIEKN